MDLFFHLLSTTAPLSLALPQKTRGWNLISEGQAKMLANRLMENLRTNLKGRLGKVYIDPEMKRYALPIAENTSQGGFGVLTRGTRLPMQKEGKPIKKLRGFTYWEKVNDIDLSVFGIDAGGKRSEFSWRTMAGRQSGAITNKTISAKEGVEVIREYDTERMIQLMNQ